MIEPKLLLKMVKRNMHTSKNPFGINTESLNTWWKNEDVSKDGDWFLFTGLMYQLAPFIDGTLSYLEKIEKSKIAQKIAFSPVFMGISGFVVGNSFSKSLHGEVDHILLNIHNLLVNSNVNVFYNPHLDNYSGIMLHDLGDDVSFELHANAIADNLKEHGVDKIITVDPHTTYAMKELYPEFTSVKFKVKSYIEMIELKNGEVERNGEFGVHDPCYYSRYCEMEEFLSSFLKKAGIPCFIPENSGEMTSCCGGAAEYSSPIISREIARLRIEEFGKREIVTACPICLISLRRGGGNVKDLAMILG